MTRIEYNQLPFEDRLDLVQESGRFVSENDAVYERTSLYVIDDFFVEVTYFPTIYNVTGVSSIENEEQLDKYLSAIELEII